MSELSGKPLETFFEVVLRRVTERDACMLKEYFAVHGFPEAEVREEAK